MSALSEISIRVEATARSAAHRVPSAALGALLSELATLLEVLHRTGEEGAIDLRSLPLDPLERDDLRCVLGTGAVDIRIEANGESRIRETAISGLWWTEHRDACGEALVVLIEVARVPSIVPAAAEDLALGVLQLRASAAAHSALPGDSPHGTT